MSLVACQCMCCQKWKKQWQERPPISWELLTAAKPRITPELAKRIAAEVVQLLNDKVLPVDQIGDLTTNEIAHIVERVGNADNMESDPGSNGPQG